MKARHVPSVSVALAERILEHLVTEADLDGLVTLTLPEIATATGVSDNSVKMALRLLSERGDLTRTRRGSNHGGYQEIQLSESVFA